MNIDPSITGSISALWLTAAILAGGYARTRNRSAWTWFLLTLFFGPLAAFLLVTWPPRDLAATDTAPAAADQSLDSRT
ncbi:hypothetical protein [Microbacterium sulfonylureivorans]|uniref:hypothetical protein n=1 Tax=Microbacterium sulfonylureivorans TaxID=2486854 RepID=UPI000FDBC40A|nr:hypothetical protein [Microbacterium sulfonylureivorans]